MMPSIMLIEDDVRLAELVSRYLEGSGFRVAIANLERHVPSQVFELAPDLVILDLGLPGDDGFVICKQLRAAYASPILILTARNNDIDHVLGLELGADDYVVKPVEPRVLVAHIHALLRRGRNKDEPSSGLLRFGALVIDRAARSVRLHDKTIALSSGEFELLACLASHPGEIQSREALFRRLYKRDYDGLDRTLDVRISHLRKKLGEDGDTSERIKTIWGQGYLFVAGAW
ncbi:MAG TPA: response regulator transcription factor [Steroidobacteraceae bacterium]